MNTQTLMATLSGAIATGLMASLPATAATFNLGGGNIGATTTFEVPVINISAPSVFSLNIGSITAANLSGVDIYLRSPGNTQTLLLGSGFQNGTFTNVTFRDSGAAIGNAPYTNLTLAPITAVNDFAGISNIDSFSSFTPTNGTWSLLVNSSSPTQEDSIRNITLDITPVPFEFSPALGVIVLGLGFGVSKIKNKFAKKAA